MAAAPAVLTYRGCGAVSPWPEQERVLAVSFGESLAYWPAGITRCSMITPPELRRQARRLSIDAEHAAEGAEKRILLDLASRLMDTASALERLERSDAPKLKPVRSDFVASAKVVKVPLP
jgi:hypothetical protein